jgi:hypothetical protein
MGFIRDNLFLVVVAAVGVVFGGILLSLKAGVASENETLLDRRRGVSRTLETLQRSTPVNDTIVRQHRKHVQDWWDEAERVRQRAIELNKRYRILRLDLGDGRLRPAFPFEFERKDLVNPRFVSAYLAELQRLFAGLNATAPPTADEILAETEQRRAVLIKDRELKLRRAIPLRPTGGEAATGVEPIVSGTIPEPPAPPGKTDETPRPEILTDQQIQEKAEREALTELVLQKAEAGLIYADQSSLDAFWVAQTGVYPTETDLWNAQINLWVQKDILEAVRRTNVEAVSRRSGRPTSGSVADAAVKRLVRISVMRGYYTGQQVVQEREREREVDVRRRPRYADDEMLELEPGRRPYRVRETEPPPRATKGGPAQKANTLTEAVSNPLYEVVHYSFRVVMPLRFIATLERNLEKLNCHTVLEWSARRWVEPANSAYYYGIEPVMDVTIRGELKLLTAWTRGVWDEKKKDWSEQYPPLVPAEVLKSPYLDSALRKEDRQRTQPRAVRGTRR